MIKVRTATERDVGDIRAIFIAAYGGHYAHPEFYNPHSLKKYIYDDDTCILVAEDSETGRLLGTASVILDLGAFGDLLGEFGRLVVHPDGRNRGIGTSLMESRLNRINQRLHIAVVENRAVHPFSQMISAAHGFSCAGFLPSKLKFDQRENISYYVRHFDGALQLRRNNPHLLPEVYELADEVLRSCGVPGDAIVDADTPAYQDSGTYELEEMTSRGYTSLLHFERGRIAHREIFGPVKLHVGFFQLRVSNYRYLLAKRNGHLVGGVGFYIDKREDTARILELVSSDAGPVRILLSEVTRLCTEVEKVAYIEVDVNAYSPAMQRTFLELGYLPAAYVPAMTFHRVERLDAVRMVRLLAPLETEEVVLHETSQAVANVVTGLFQRHSVNPAVAAAIPRIALFAGLNEEQGRRLAALCRLASFLEGERLTTAAEDDGMTYLLLKGSAEVRLDPGSPPVGRVEAGETIGELSLLHPAPHTATTTATGDIEAAVIERAALEDLVRRRPDIGLILYRNLAAQLGDKLLRADESLVR